MAWRPRRLLAAAGRGSPLALVGSAPAAARPTLTDDGGAEWQVEQPAAAAAGRTGRGTVRSTPVSLGHIGDIEFYAPNRGAALITSRQRQHDPARRVVLQRRARGASSSNQCGASDGRIAWAGPDEFWTISDGRPGQALARGSERPPTEDNTLCHFAPGPTGKLEIVASYASQAVPRRAPTRRCTRPRACRRPTAGLGANRSAEPQVGAFQLHWNGHALEPEPYLPEGHAVRELSASPSAGACMRACSSSNSDRVEQVPRPPPLLTIIDPESEKAVRTGPEYSHSTRSRRVSHGARLPAPRRGGRLAVGGGRAADPKRRPAQGERPGRHDHPQARGGECTGDGPPDGRRS